MTKVTLRRLTIVTSHRLTTVTSRRLTALVAALVKHKPSCDVTSSVRETERALHNNLVVAVVAAAVAAVSGV